MEPESSRIKSTFGVACAWKIAVSSPRAARGGKPANVTVTVRKKTNPCMPLRRFDAISVPPLRFPCTLVIRPRGHRPVAHIGIHAHAPREPRRGLAARGDRQDGELVVRTEAGLGHGGARKVRLYRVRGGHGGPAREHRRVIRSRRGGG